MEKSYEYNQDIFMLFINYKQAYDSIVREELWIVMRDLEVSIKLIRLIRSCLQNSKWKIKVNDYISKEFEVKTGLRQGDALSSMFYNITLKSVIRGLDDTHIKIRLINKNINLSAYTNDVVLIGKTEDKIKSLIKLLIERSKSMRLMVNEGKTK